LDPANFKRRVEFGLTWGTRIRTGAGCKNPDSVSGIDAAGISTGIVGRVSVRLMAAPPHVGSILKLRLEPESGSALQDPRNGNRAELCVRLDPFGFIDRPDVTANLNSGDENNETGKMSA
jgi:hypothetical protein